MIEILAVAQEQSFEETKIMVSNFSPKKQILREDFLKKSITRAVVKAIDF